MSQILGCPQGYTVMVTHRGGGAPVGVLDGVSSLTWDRKYNGAGAASITMGQGQVSSNCCRLLHRLGEDRSQGAYEIAIYRDNDLVWCGPILTLTETVSPTQQQFTITASDVLGYLDRHWLQAGYNLTGDVVEIASTVIGTDLLTDDPGIGRGIVKTDSGVVITRAAGRASNTILGEMNALVTLGLRYTTAVRTLYLGGQQGTPFGSRIKLTMADIAGTVTMLHDATAYANTVYGTSGNAASQIPAGVIPPDDPQLVIIGGPEPENWRGRMETGVTAAGGTNGVSTVAAAAQTAYFNARLPRVLRVADDSQLSPTATVTVPQLICGSLVTLAAQDQFCTFAAEDLQLIRVQGTYDQNGEKIGISLGPVS
jgi:hypothetical protein